MSREDVELVRNAFGAFATEGLDWMARWLADDAEYVEDPIWPESASYHGRDAIVARFRSYMEALGDESATSATVERVVDAGDHQVAVVRIASRASAHGLPHEHVWGYDVEVRDGRIRRLRAYYDPAEALALAAAER